MPATATREKPTTITNPTNQSQDIVANKTITRNRFSKRPTRAMLSDTYINPETGEIDPQYGREFVLETIDRWFISSLELPKSEFIALVEEAYQWHENSAKREKQASVHEFLNDLDGDTETLQILQTELKARLEANKSTKNGR